MVNIFLFILMSSLAAFLAIVGLKWLWIFQRLQLEPKDRRKEIIERYINQILTRFVPQGILWVWGGCTKLFHWLYIHVPWNWMGLWSAFAFERLFRRATGWALIPIRMFWAVIYFIGGLTLPEDLKPEKDAEFNLNSEDFLNVKPRLFTRLIRLLLFPLKLVDLFRYKLRFAFVQAQKGFNVVNPSAGSWQSPPDNLQKLFKQNKEERQENTKNQQIKDLHNIIDDED